jgi:hypothetical protein
MALDIKDFTSFGKLGSPGVDPDIWSLKMKYVLKSKKLFTVVETAISATPSNEEKETDTMAKTVLALCVADHHLVTVDKAANAKAAWDALMDIYKSNTAAQLQRTRREFNTLSLQGNESITDYTARAQTLRSRLEASSQKIDDKTFIITILDGLPSGYSAISTFIENTADMPSLSEVQGMLLRTEEKLSLNVRTRTTPTTPPPTRRAGATTATRRATTSGSAASASTTTKGPCWLAHPRLLVLQAATWSRQASPPSQQPCDPAVQLW